MRLLLSWPLMRLLSPLIWPSGFWRPALLRTPRALARSSGRRHPVFGLWPVSIRQDLRAALIEDGLRKIDDFTDRFSLAIADFAGHPDPFSI